MTIEIVMAWWNEYYPVVVALGGTIVTVGGIILTAYLKFKPIWENIKAKIDSIKDNTSVDSVKADLDAKLKAVDIDVKIAELQDKINNPLTSETSRKIYTQSLQVLIEMKTKLDNGIDIVDETTSKF